MLIGSLSTSLRRWWWFSPLTNKHQRDLCTSNSLIVDDADAKVYIYTWCVMLIQTTSFSDSPPSILLRSLRDVSRFIASVDRHKLWPTTHSKTCAEWDARAWAVGRHTTIVVHFGSRLHDFLPNNHCMVEWSEVAGCVVWSIRHDVWLLGKYICLGLWEVYSVCDDEECASWMCTLCLGSDSIIGCHTVWWMFWLSWKSIWLGIQSFEGVRFLMLGILYLYNPKEIFFPFK